MFSDLFWAIYWIDILSGLGRQLLVALLLAAIPLVIYVMVYDCNKPGPTGETVKRGFWRTLVPVFLLVFALSFIPSKQTMYVMLGIKTTQNVMESPLGKKLQSVVDAEIDGYLSKLPSKKSKE